MKYIAQMAYKHRMIDELILETDDREEAIAAAKKMFNRLSEHDKKELAFLNVFESINPDPEADDHLDGDIIFEI